MSDVDLYKQMMGAETAVCTPFTPITLSSTPSRRPSEDRREYDREDREMFSKLEKPRVRYDVEVITKLIVYTGTISMSSPRRYIVTYIKSGIAWIAVEGNPILFELIGLGIGVKDG